MFAVPQAVEEDEIPAPVDVPPDDATPGEESDAASEEPEDALP